MSFRLGNEIEAYGALLRGHLVPFVRRLKALPPDLWDWTPHVAAPTPRMLAEHTWQWLVCDRHHLEIADVSAHPLLPDPPKEPAAMIALLEEEANTWMRFVAEMSPERLDEPVWQFGDTEGNVRGFICHMIQHVSYKHGQFAELYFALGMDGEEPYQAPWPNEIYREVRAAQS